MLMSDLQKILCAYMDPHCDSQTLGGISAENNHGDTLRDWNACYGNKNHLQ
jgi:hypothetical protein